MTMKILYARPSQAIELDYRNTSVNSLGTDLRLGIIEAMIALGHEVSFGTAVKPAEANLLATGRTLLQDAGFPDFDYTFLKKIKPFTRAEDYDLLFIEGSSTNTLFTSWGDKESDTAKFYRLVDAFRGKVILYQHGDHQLALPFGHAYGATESTSPLNASNIYECIEGLSEGKVWKIFTHAFDIPAFLESYNTKAYQYKNIGIPVETTPIGYSPNFDKAPLDNLVDLHRPYDLIYVGSQRKGQHRTKKLLKFLSNTGLKIKVVGKWEFSGMHEGIEFVGQQGKHGDVYDIYKDGYCVLQLADALFEECGMMTTRAVQAIRSNCVLFADADIKGANAYTLLGNVVSTKEELMAGIARVKDAVSQTGRLDRLRGFRQMCLDQYALLSPWVNPIAYILSGDDSFRPINIEAMEGERAARKQSGQRQTTLI